MTDTDATLGSRALLIWRTAQAVVLLRGTGGIIAASAAYAAIATLLLSFII